MLPFAAAGQLSDTEISIAARAMLKVAHTDGIHPAEVALIRAFYEDGVETSGLPLFDDILSSSTGDFHVDAARFSDSENRELLLTLCVLTAYADGHCSAQEQTVLNGLAADMDITLSRLAELQAIVKDSLLASLAHLPDTASVAVVAGELG
ncbi:MAG: TerB family tellurite resistance protein [Fluviicoccus sp.]|uniref:tellurite resistance TerB family protein n=1 Tax=Fluviicoccus sp. TaxID=2003552 RepID=UPI002715BD63|nr:TerB family tellurite resistance protein [Fluviicoccus sp.]MDO8329349.1 TerB family tellurite resistance protein [Fluviicoccus sp.]